MVDLTTITKEALTDVNFEKEALSSDILLLTDFRAEWCGPCRIMGL